MTIADLKSALPQLGSRDDPRRVRSARPYHFSKADRLEVIHLTAERSPLGAS
jgi:hypothetical protein